MSAGYGLALVGGHVRLDKIGIVPGLTFPLHRLIRAEAWRVGASRRPAGNGSRQPPGPLAQYVTYVRVLVP